MLLWDIAALCSEQAPVRNLHYEPTALTPELRPRILRNLAKVNRGEYIRLLDKVASKELVATPSCTLQNFYAPIQFIAPTGAPHSGFA